MSAPVLKKVSVLFHDEGDLEIAVAYTHTDEPPTPGTKTRTTKALRMAAVGLRAALEYLDTRGAITWGGYATDTRETEDRIIVEREENAA